MSEIPQITKKPVIVTAITVKFPIIDGWTKELLVKYCTRGGFLRIGSGQGLDFECWVPEFDSIINYEQMYADGHIGTLLDKHLYWDLCSLSDIDIMKKKG